MLKLSVVFLVCVGIATTSATTASHAQRVHRSIFYEDTPFGSLAWVSGSATRSAARGKLMVNDLSAERCILLPAVGVQWFLINHSDADLEGQTGYFSVRILYNYGPDEQPPQHAVGLHLHRNGNWFDATNRQVTTEYERNSDRITLSGQAFISLHDPADEASGHRYEQLRREVGDWHMRPTSEDGSSWDERYLYGPMLRAYLSQTSVAISARLIRFTATSGTWSNNPIVFWLDPRGARAATILIDAPRHVYSGSRRVYSVKFGGACP